MITSIKCPKCQRIFVYSFHSKSCVCGWEPSQDAKKGIEEVGKKKKNKRKGSREMTTNVTVGNSAVIGNDSWEVEIDQVHECSKAPKEQKVLVELFAKRKINELMKKYPSIEWLAYLMGDKENDPYTVKDIFIPTQEVSATTVDSIVCPEFNSLPIIGVIHSHHGMGNGFSGTDHEWINKNHNISLCISKTGIAGQVRITTPCGALKIIPAVIKVKYPESSFDFDTWVTEETKKITQKTYARPVHQSYNWQGSNYSGKAWHAGQPGIWHNGVFFPENDPSERVVPRNAGNLTESQRKYVNGVAVVPEKKEEVKTETTSDDEPTIDEDMSLAEALSALEVSLPNDSVEPNDSKENWDSGL